MADRKIRYLFTVIRAEIIETKQVLPFVGSHVNVPRDLSSRDLDWTKSCPTTPWQHGDVPWVQVHLAKVELSSADVMLTLCGGRERVKTSTEGNLQARGCQSRGKSTPTRGQAQAEIGESMFDPKEWITIDAAAKILRFERDSSDGSGRLRLMEPLRREPSVARIVAATLPPLVSADVEPTDLIPLPDRFVCRRPHRPRSGVSGGCPREAEAANIGFRRRRYALTCRTTAVVRPASPTIY